MKSATSHKSPSTHPQHQRSSRAFDAAPDRGPSTPLTTVALAAALMAMLPLQARAAGECGAEAAGADALTCSGASYPAGIHYTGSDGLTLNLNNPAMVVPAGSVSIVGVAGNTNDLVVHAASLTSIAGSISIANPGNGAGLITMDSGSVTTATGSSLSVTNASGSGDVRVTMNGGQVTSDSNLFLGAALLASVTGTATGNATVTMTGGTVVTSKGVTIGMHASVGNATSSANSTVNLSGGSVSTLFYGAYSQTSGLGEAVITMSGGTVTANTRGLYAQSSNAASSANARVLMQGGSVTATSATGTARGINSQSVGGQAIVDMSGGTVSAPGNNADGMLAQSTGSGRYAVNVTGGTVSGGGGFGAAIRTAAAAGGTLDIGAGAVINAGGSGIAIGDGDVNHDGTDEIGGNAVITTAGTVNGSVVLGGGTDALTITGGTINGNITGDGPDKLAFDLGAGTFSYGAAHIISGMESVTMRSGTAQIDSAIGGTTAVNVDGGKLVLTAANTYTGTTTVNSGVLQLGTRAAPASIAGDVAVLAGGRLQGTGAVGHLAVAGTIAPGHSIGTLDVNGNFTQASGSTYQAEVDPASIASDLIHASGSASLAGGAQLEVVRAGAANYGIGNRYTVLSADGGVAGTYTLTGDYQSAFARLVDSYDANHVYLTVEKTRSVASAGGTGNQAAVGAAIDSMPAGNALATAVTWLPTDFAARDALNQLSADIHASTQSAMLEDSRFVREAAIDRLRSAACAPGGTTQPQQRPGATCAPEAGTGVTGWAQVFGSWGHIDSDGNASRLDRDIGGFMVGADTAVGAGWRAGGLVGYSRSTADTSARNSDSKTDSYHLALYGGTQWNATALRLGLGHSWNHVDTERSVAFAGFAGNLTSDYDTGTTQAFAEVGHRIDVGRAAVEPFAGLAYVSLGSSSFSEEGGPAALYGHGESLSTAFSSLGVRASLPVGEQTRLRGMLAWRHAFGDTAPMTTQVFSGSLPFTLSGVPLAENVAALDAGVETQLRPNLTLSASYSGQFGDGLQDHGAKVELNWKF